MNRSTENKIMFVGSLIAILIFSFSWARYRKAKAANTKEISTVSVFNPETGAEKIYHVAKFIEMKEGYASFETVNGMVVELVENQVREK